MYCAEHGTLDYCPECLESDPKQIVIVAAERAVIDAAVGDDSRWPWKHAVVCGHPGTSCTCGLSAFRAAVGALRAARMKP